MAWDDFAILAAETLDRVTRNLHVAFVADSRADVDAFWQAGIDAGYASDGEPGERPGRRWEAGVQFRGPWATFTLMAAGRSATENLHMAFIAPERRVVDEFHVAAVAAGYASNGAPGLRPAYAPDYYAAFVLDPDGANVESVFRSC